MKLRKIFSLILILCVTLQLIGCTSKNTPIYTGADFDSFTDQLFLSEVQSDSVTLNYTIAKPEDYGIKDYVPTFGTYTQKEIKNSHKTAKKYIKDLKLFDYKTLSTEQKKTYDILLKYMKERCYPDKLILYNEVLSPTTGLQAQLPVLLAEYHFYNKQDIDNYITLLNQLNTYFTEIAKFEKAKSKAGLFMSDTSANAVISQCSAFIKEKDNNYLITLFNQKIDSYTALTDKEKENYKAKLKDAVFNSVIPAYEMLIQELTALKGTGKNNGGLCKFKNGKDFYKYLVKTNTGSDRSMKEINKILDKTASDCLIQIAGVASSDADIQKKLESYYYSLTEPREILTYLQDAIKEDFPSLNNVNCEVKYVDKSLEEYLSPAFYLTPQIDNYKENCIYVNQNKKYDLSEIFPTIAHEGYPGHLYQNCYYNQQNPSLIRHILNFEGYSEGWATYVEMYSYSISGLDENVSKILVNNQIATLCLYAKCDLNINYYGWDLDATKKYLKSFGLTNGKVAENIYNSMIQEPCSYLKYTLGYLEISMLRQKAETELGEKFSAKEFNKFILDMGPCQFSILEKYMDKWIENQ